MDIYLFIIMQLIIIWWNHWYKFVRDNELDYLMECGKCKIGEGGLCACTLKESRQSVRLQLKSQQRKTNSLPGMKTR